MANNFMIIGLSNFGAVLARALYSLGENVLVLEENKDKIQEIKDAVTQAVVGDASDKKILERLVSNPDITAIICLGDKLEKTVMVTYHLKQLGIRKIIAKANSEDQGKVLQCIGASEIVYPEKDMAVRMAEKLHNPHLLDHFSLGENYAIIEVHVPKMFAQKSLIDLKLRNKYKVNVLCIRDTTSNEMATPDANYVLKESDRLIVLGEQKNIHNFSQDVIKDL